MFVHNPDPYLLPCYRISPFRTSDIVKNQSWPESQLMDQYLTGRFTGQFIYTENGREAISLALQQLGLKKNDVVTILTTSNNRYISSCVTTEIERYCHWSREMVAETKVLFVNHEFGYSYPDLAELKKTGLPIIEDCAASFFTKGNGIGTFGDFVIYSFPKMFPIQIGGLLVNNTDVKLEQDIDDDRLRYIKNALSGYISQENDIIRKRWENYHYLKTAFSGLGFPERFTDEEGSVPSVFMFRTNGSGIDLPLLKEHFYRHGIQCSVFYGEEAFFIPVHQAIEKAELDYFISVFKLFLNIKR